ncbi:hypothetical protein Ae201684_003525 [Aphanomyces euteiches]|uniref:Uncharacterized protein n=1 Tax=Aphanomyces euteiches TaxID=100861 RepID=A0A6G0XLY8_9STRA|nr:hypothetical protein Ae201684_003525 [Aphanomyces euteiches]KAH9145361.1 hypothetical protein AeRB84_010714 [Aphanomyces euteiches]
MPLLRPCPLPQMCAPLDLVQQVGRPSAALSKLRRDDAAVAAPKRTRRSAADPRSMLANCSPLQPPTPQRFSSGLVINGLDATRPENRWERGNASTMSLDLRPSFGNESSLVSAASAPSSSQNQVAFNP